MYMYIYTHIYMCVYIYIYIHTHTQWEVLGERPGNGPRIGLSPELYEEGQTQRKQYDNIFNRWIKILSQPRMWHRATCKPFGLNVAKTFQMAVWWPSCEVVGSFVTENFCNPADKPLNRDKRQPLSNCIMVVKSK